MTVLSTSADLSIAKGFFFFVVNGMPMRIVLVLLEVCAWACPYIHSCQAPSVQSHLSRIVSVDYCNADSKKHKAFISCSGHTAGQLHCD